ncbi:4-hydroxyphenylacetate 3-monooxygenase, oxygenase component [Siminovitchia sp. FSL W7-1587]|uniref:4-hydroxyphenylacetate 3-monooxygenase, oxygenase component n=1 Tax=Siminovitchia sp. FSL W7-1587 TaxID=2954699 RepID=UPI0030D2FE5C
MGIIDGTGYIDRLNRMGAEIWLDGKKVEGHISDHPSFQGVVRTIASLYDLQNKDDLKEQMTFLFPDQDEPVGLSYLHPKTKDDLIRRRKMIEHWARHTHGMFGRSPDYMNTVIMSFASSAAFLKGMKNCFPEHIISLYKRAMKEDLSFAHAFITPQINRSQINLGFTEEALSAKVIERNEKGIVIKGARMLATLGGFTDEVLVYTAPRIFFDPNEAFAFSIPSNTEGLKFICRESFVGGKSTFNYPLSSRYEEMDSIVVFDNVLVPWENVFFYDNLEAATDFKLQSSFHPLAYHQVIIRQIEKTEFLLGVAQMLAETINVGEYQHVQEKISEIISGYETMKSLLAKSENDAELDDWGCMRPSLVPLKVAGTIFPKLYPRFAEIVQLIGASGLVTLPPENDFASPISTYLHKCLQGTDKSAVDRVKIFRLAWDLTMSSFGTRQTQYERYFFGDPVKMASNLYQDYPKEKSLKLISDFLHLEHVD